MRDAVLLNAAAALAVHDAPGEDPQSALTAGLVRATESVDSGSAQAALERWVAASGSLSRPSVSRPGTAPCAVPRR